MKRDPTRCPVDQAIEIVGGKWKPLVLWRLSVGTLRFGQLQRSIPLVTQRMLTLQLRELEKDGLVKRTVYPEVPPKVEYRLTTLGRSLLPVLQSLGEWFMKHATDLSAAAAARAQAPEPAPEQISIKEPASRVRH